MRKYLFLVGIYFSVLWAQQERLNLFKGNQLYKQGEYLEAQKEYEKIDAAELIAIANFNLGNSLFRQEKYPQAQNQFERVLTMSQDSVLRADAYHNIGNSLLQQKKLKESLSYYKDAIKTNPALGAALYNYNAVKKLLEQQENQDKKDQNKDQENKDKKDQNKDQENKDKQDQNKDQDKKDKKDQSDQEKKEEEQKEEAAQAAEDKGELSKEEAERLLDAFQNKNKDVKPEGQSKKAKTNMKNKKNW